MSTKQQTLKAPISFSGKGLHTGVKVTMTVNPAEVDTGIVFRRTDLEGQPIIPALCDYVVDTSRGKTVVGDHNLLMAYVHIAHDDVVGSNCVIANRVSLAGEVEIGDWVVIGGHAAIHQWTRIGDHAMIQGGALLGQDAPPFVIVRNDTMRFAGINKIGLSRRGFTPERIGEIHDACRILFQSGLNYMSGCEEVEKQVPQSKERDELVKFIRESKRGIFKPYESVSKEE